MKIITLKLISAYQNFISPLFLPSCRFSPSCSAYAKEAIETLPIKDVSDLYNLQSGVVKIQSRDKIKEKFRCNISPSFFYFAFIQHSVL